MFAENRNILVGRFVLAGFAHSGLFVLARTEGAELYGILAFTIFLAKSVVSFTLGINQGFIYYLLKDKSDYYATYFLSYLVIYSAVCAFYGLVYGSLALISCILVLPLITIEPFAKSNKNYFVVFFPEAILVSAFLFASLASYSLNIPFPVYMAELLTFALVMSTMWYLRGIYSNFFSRLASSEFRWSKVGALVSQGFPSYLFGSIYFLFLLVDRTLVEKIFGIEAMATIMLAYQFAMLSGFVVSTLNATAIVRIAEELDGSHRKLKAYILVASFRAIAINSFFLVVAVIFSFILRDNFFKEFVDLPIFVVIIGVGILFFNLYGVVSPVLFYYRKQYLPVILLAITLACSLFLYAGKGRYDLSIVEIQLYIYSIFSVSMLASFFYAHGLVNRAVLSENS